MAGQKTIHISSEELSANVITESEITQEMVQRIEKVLDSMVNSDICHDIRGRITSVNMSLYMLEKVIPPEVSPRLQMLKTQIEDLSRIIEGMTE